jgi:predicted ester cyclase
MHVQPLDFSLFQWEVDMKNIFAAALVATTLTFTVSEAYAANAIPAAVQSFYNAINGDPSQFAVALDPQWVVHPSSPIAPPSDFKAYAEAAAKAVNGLQGLSYKIEAVHVAGDFVTVRGTISAKQGGAWFGIPSTGKNIRMGAIDVHRLANGKIAESWHIEDFVSAFQQVGSFPPAQ